MTYPLKFRQQVLATKQQNELTFEETAKRLNIAVRKLFRWKQKIEPCTTRNKHATKVNMEALKQDVEYYPDAYQNLC